MPDSVEYVYSNVGIAPVSSSDSIQMIFGNVGYYLPTQVNSIEQIYSNVGRQDSIDEDSVEYVYGYVDPTRPALEDGPNWAGVDAGTVQWIPGTIYNNKRFVRYRMWDGTKWQTS